MGRPNSCSTAALIASGESASTFPSPGERPERQSAHAWMREKYGPRGGVRIGSQINPRRGYVELVAVGPTENTVGHEIERAVDHRIGPPAIRSITLNRMRAPHRHT